MAVHSPLAWCLIMFIKSQSSVPLFLMRPTTENFEIPTRKKIWTHEIRTRKNFGPIKYPREKNLGARNTMRKKFQPTKYPREKILNPRNIHEKTFWTHKITRKARWHDDTGSMRPKMSQYPQNLAHSLVWITAGHWFYKLWSFCVTKRCLRRKPG